MAHSEKQQPDFSHNPDLQNRQKTQALSRDIEDLNTGLRTDFDQKLSEIADLLARFKALVFAPAKAAANDETSNPGITLPANPAEAKEANVTPLFNSSIVNDETSGKCAEELLAPDLNNACDPADIAAPEDTPFTAPVTQSHYSPEPARFETGLYKLNSQLYRFRLELDQEMEFREEQLHLHFRKESELSMMFQKLSDTSSEKNSGS